MSILESPLFKHTKPLKEKADSIATQDANFLSEQLIRTAFTLPKKLEKEYVFLGEQIQDMPYRPEIDRWIKCRYRIRRSQGKGKGVESYCLNPFHPFIDYGLWLPVCLKKECELDKICDDDPDPYL